MEENNRIEENKRITIALSEAIMRGDWAAVDGLLAPEFTYIGDGRSLNRAGYVVFMREVLCRAMTDMKMTFPRVIAEGDLVAVEYTNEMTHTGDFFGAPASGKRVLGTGHFIRQIAKGKVVAEWQTTNALGLMAQLKG